MIKLIIAGGRDFQDLEALDSALLSFMAGIADDVEVTVISGMARGADQLGIALAQKYELPLIKMPADWDTHGKSAGFIRNTQMAKVGTHLLAAWDGKSKGTRNMIDTATRLHLTVKVLKY
jgi:hypothetical protein